MNQEDAKNIKDFQALNNLINESFRSLNKNEQLHLLRKFELSDITLVNLFISALDDEDYKICDICKSLFKERGLSFIPED